jgi:hypothetical protein
MSSTPALRSSLRSARVISILFAKQRTCVEPEQESEAPGKVRLPESSRGDIRVQLDYRYCFRQRLAV